MLKMGQVCYYCCYYTTGNYYYGNLTLVTCIMYVFQVFLTSRAVYVIVFNLCDDLMPVFDESSKVCIAHFVNVF